MGQISPPQTETDLAAVDRTEVTVTVRFFAAARAASGVDEEPIAVPAPATVADVIAATTARHGEPLRGVLDRCSYLHNATAVHDTATPIVDGDQLDVLPPFAGG